MASVRWVVCAYSLAFGESASLGGIMATTLGAVEPEIEAIVPIAGGGEVGRLLQQLLRVRDGFGRIMGKQAPKRSTPPV